MQMDMVPRLCRQTDILYYSQLDGNCKYIGYEMRNSGGEELYACDKIIYIPKNWANNHLSFPTNSGDLQDAAVKFSIRKKQPYGFICC